MSPAPLDREPRALLVRWAAGDAAAVDALVAACLPALHVKLGGDQAALEAAVRRVFTHAPRFVLTQPAKLHALLARLVAQQLASDAPRAPREPVHAGAAATVLDLDRGSTSSAETAAEKSAWTKLALLLLTPGERTLLLGHWAGLAEASLAAKAGVPAGEFAAHKSAVVQRHDDFVRQLKRGALDAILQSGDGTQSAAADPWGMPTQWSMVLGAVAKDDRSRVQQSWRRLLDRYRDPIALAIRRALRGSRESAGGDLVEEFFTYLFEHDVLSKVDPENGRFRAYIQAVLKRFLHKRRRGQRDHAEFDEGAAPGAQAADLVAERADESAWASHVLRLALADLLARSPRDGDVLVRYYGIPWPDPGATASPQSREQLAAALGTTLGSIDQATYRARRLLRACIERELRETVQSPSDHATEVEVIARRLLEAHPGLL